MRQTIAAIIISAISLPATAQPTFPTEFPAGATELSTEELTKLLEGRVYRMKPAKGPEVRIEYRGEWAFIKTGNTRDSGKWKLDKSAICVEWKALRPGCSEVRLVGDLLYSKRPSNGEVLPVVPD